MRCSCCDKRLSDYEMSLKGKLSGEYLYMSLSCIRAAEIAYTGNNSLKKIVSRDEEDVLEDKEYKSINLEKPIWERNEYEDE